jgi:hypothetical protein
MGRTLEVASHQDLACREAHNNYSFAWNILELREAESRTGAQGARGCDKSSVLQQPTGIEPAQSAAV